MKLYHVTHRKNLPSILARGLDPLRAKGVRKAVWGVVRTRVAWAIIHVLGKPWHKNATLGDLVVIEIQLPRRDVRRYKSGIWYTSQNVSVKPGQVIEAGLFGKVP
jgi:hypothetical protein